MLYVGSEPRIPLPRAVRYKISVVVASSLEIAIE